MVTAIINLQKSGGNSQVKLWDNFISKSKLFYYLKRKLRSIP